MLFRSKDKVFASKETPSGGASGSRKEGARSEGGKPSAREGGKPYSGAPKPMVRKIWVLEEAGLKNKPVQKTIRVGLSDGAATEILPDQEGNYGLKAGDLVIVGSSGKAGVASSMPKATGPRLF